MKFIVDFHIHSHYSRATSKKLTPEHLDHYAKIKGINVIGTGDCIHPGWFSELKEKLELAENGLYKLKKEFQIPFTQNQYAKISQQEVYFLLTTEISSIYKKNNQVRKVHNVCVFPDFEAVSKMQDKLEKIGNIRSDGRPILGLDAKILLEMLLEVDSDAYLIPAHIWTPWFAVLGSKSGFNSIEECFDDLTPYIFAVETGLSSDPPMNRVCSFLDKFRLVSNSDAHSLDKLGREANLFDTALSYNSILASLKYDNGFLGTIEFFPQEGKYHYDGHRLCNVVCNPLETVRHQGICPVCHKPLTKGVMYRVAELADRKVEDIPEFNQQHYSITPLLQILAEIVGVKSSSSTKVQAEYYRLINNLGSEFDILLNCPLPEIKDLGSPVLAQAIQRLRDGQVQITEGYDGEFGRVKLFQSGENSVLATHASLFQLNSPKISKPELKNSVEFNIQEFKDLQNKESSPTIIDQVPEVSETKALNLEQDTAIQFDTGVCLVLAGPGAGKTRVLTERIMYLLKNKHVDPSQILALTFSNQAAREIRTRIQKKNKLDYKQVYTFHALGLRILREYSSLFNLLPNFSILDQEEKVSILAKLGIPKSEQKKAMTQIEKHKQIMAFSDIDKTNDFPLWQSYHQALQEHNAVDLEDLLYLPVRLFTEYPAVLKQYQEELKWILVDECQDLNQRQYEFITLLAGEGNPNLFLIGDADQAIYGFRGADVELLTQLSQKYTASKTINLQQSYRCPHKLMQVAGQVLNKKAFLKGHQNNIEIKVQELATDKSEADYVATQIETMIGGVHSLSFHSKISDGQNLKGINSFADMAVLCRSSIMFDHFIKAFNDHGIAYQVIGQQSFFQKPIIKALIKELKDIYYKTDFYLSAHSSLTKQPYLIEKVREFITEKEYVSDLLSFLIKWKNCSLETAGAKPVLSGDQLIAQVVLPAQKISRFDEMELLKFAAQYEDDYEGFFRDIVLRASIDDYKQHIEAVSLMTMHSAKGLEFNCVFLPGCEDNIIPFELYGTKNQKDLAEEERLFYVALTRTKQYLFLTHAKKRSWKGRILQQNITRFLQRPSTDLLQFEKNIPAKSFQASLFK